MAVLPDAEYSNLISRWREAHHGAPVLLTRLPRRVRLRLAVTRRRDGVAYWLVCRKRFRMAEWLWRATGAWS